MRSRSAWCDAASPTGGERARADVDVAQRVELAVAREREQATLLVEREEGEAAVGLLVEGGEVALRDLGDVDRRQPHAGALESLHARADALAPRRDGDELRRTADAGGIGGNRHRIDDRLVGGEIDRVLDRPAQRFLGLGDRDRRRRQLDDVVGAGIERGGAAQAGQAERLADAHQVVGFAAAALELAHHDDLRPRAAAAHQMGDADAARLQVDRHPAGSGRSVEHGLGSRGWRKWQGVAAMLGTGRASGRSKSGAFGGVRKAVADGVAVVSSSRVGR